MLCMSSECEAPGYLGCCLRGFHLMISDVDLANAPPPGETHEPLTMPRSVCVAALVLIPVLRIALSGQIPGLGLRGLGAR